MLTVCPRHPGEDAQSAIVKEYRYFCRTEFKHLNCRHTKWALFASKRNQTVVKQCKHLEINMPAAKTSMLYKEILPPALTAILLAPALPGRVLACALDNAGAAFALNSMTCGCQRTLHVMQPLADSLTRHGVGLVADHTHRERNAHADEMSHLFPVDVWSRLVPQAEPRRAKTEIHFAIADLSTRECFTATMAFAQFSNPDAAAAAR